MTTLNAWASNSYPFGLTDNYNKVGVPKLKYNLTYYLQSFPAKLRKTLKSKFLNKTRLRVNHSSYKKNLEANLPKTIVCTWGIIEKLSLQDKTKIKYIFMRVVVPRKCKPEVTRLNLAKAIPEKEIQQFHKIMQEILERWKDNIK